MMCNRKKPERMKGKNAIANDEAAEYVACPYKKANKRNFINEL